MVHRKSKYPMVHPHSDVEKNESKPARVAPTRPLAFESKVFHNLNNLKGYSQQHFYNYIMYMAACLPNYVRTVNMHDGIVELDIDPKGQFLVMNFMDEFQNKCILTNPSQIDVDSLKQQFINVEDPFIDDHIGIYTQSHSCNYDEEVDDADDDICL